MTKSNKHKNYELLNLLGYGLSKFDNSFINEFGIKTKSDFFEYFVKIGIVETRSVIKNRMDLFDPFFLNKRKGWWQKGNAYIHRKYLIDSLFGNADVKEFANIVKLCLDEKYEISVNNKFISPIVKSRYRKLQETGLEAELYFIHNFNSIATFKNGKIEDARLYGDGYDFQVNVESGSFLAEIKGIREKKGKFKLTENEFIKANEYKNDYIITLVVNLNEIPYFITIENPIQNLEFREISVSSKIIKEYHLTKDIS